MSLHESGGLATTPPPMTRREAREREEAARSAAARAIFTSAGAPLPSTVVQPQPVVEAQPQSVVQAQPVVQPQIQPTAQPVVYAQPVAQPVAQAEQLRPRVRAEDHRLTALKAHPRAAPPPPAPRPTAHTGRRLLSLGALLFAGTLLVAVSVPANAFMSDASAVPPTAKTDAQTLPGQSLAVSGDAVSAQPVRDGYVVISYAERLRQTYGRTGTYTATTGAVRWPFPYSVPISDGYGLRDVNISGRAFHQGVDFTPGAGTPIYAIADGVVTIHANEYGGLGNNVMISHVINGQNIDSVYAHMEEGSCPLKVGDPIKVGDFIGLVGDTGTATGPHLHFELHIDKVPVDPFSWLTDNAVN